MHRPRQTGFPGEPIIVPKPNTYAELEERVKEIKQNRNGMSWYLSFKESSRECNEKNNEKQFT